MAINRKDDSDNYERSYRELLDEMYSPIVIGLSQFDASDILEKLDPIAYQTGLNDYADSCDDERECSECGEVYDTEEEAEECCAERTDEEIEEDNRETK